MLQLSEVKVLLQDSLSSKRFKYWSEVFIDLLLIGLFILVVLSWQSIFYAEASGLLCVFLNQDNLDLQISDGRYISSRCLLDSPAKLLLFFPYVQFLQFLLLMISQVMWLRVPKVRSKIDLFDDIFVKINEMEPRFEKVATNMVPSFTIEENNRDYANMIHDKLFFLITENSCIVFYYGLKNIIHFVLLILFITVNIFGVVIIIQNGVDFECQLEPINKKIFPPISCNISPFYYFIGYICLFQIILLIHILLTSLNLYFLHHTNHFKSQVNDILGEVGEKLCYLPGFLDFSMFITIHNKNIKDGGFILQMMKYIINIRNASNFPASSNFLQPSSDLNEQKTISDVFTEEVTILSGIAEKLCMRIDFKPYTNTHLYDCLVEINSKQTDIDIHDTFSMKERVLDEIKLNTIFYAYLESGSTSNHVQDVELMLQNFNKYLHQLQDETIFPNNLVVAAAANLLEIKIVVVKAFSKSTSYVDNLEIFEPYSKLCKNPPTIMMSLIYPHYYNIFNPMDTDLIQVIENRERFINRFEFRRKIIDEYRKNAIKHLLNDSVRGHKKTGSFFNSDNIATQRVYDDEFLQTILPSSRLATTKFRMAGNMATRRNDYVPPTLTPSTISSNLL